MQVLPTLWRNVVDEEPDLWLFAVLRRGAELGELTNERVDALLNELTEIASRRMRALVMKTPFEQGRHRALRASLERANLGLEHLTRADTSRAVVLLRDTTLSRLDAEGDALIEAVRHRAEAVRKELTLANTSPSPFDETDELELVNAVEEMFFDGLRRGELALHRVVPRLTEAAIPGPIRSLRDVRKAHAMLDAFDARAEIFRAFPRERLFARTFETDVLADTARVVLSRLYIRLATNDADELRFDISDADIRRFEEVRDLDATRNRLLRWIESFVHDRISHAHRRRAHEYLLACLESIADVLPFLDARDNDVKSVPST
jgi:hypothetical protein